MSLIHIPHFEANVASIEKAFRIAIGDLCGNVIPYKDGLLDTPREVIIAGLDYCTPWTRDAAINVWNGASVLMPGVGKSTLLSVLEKRNGRIYIGGQYWDSIIWAIGAWWHYLYSGDMEFLETAYQAITNTIDFFEFTEFNQELNLFRGPACYGDGIGAYPDIYTKTNGASNITEWVAVNPDKASKPGFGIPMHTLSTNCLYYQAYVVLKDMAAEMRVNADNAWEKKASALKDAINKWFWMPEAGYYRYIVDSLGNCDHQEGMGHSFALLLGIADEPKAESIFKEQFVSQQGIPCVYPSFKRYDNEDGMSFGRHSGTVWPHIQALWACAAAQHGKLDIFEKELFSLASNACRDLHFAEIYHPVTGEVYGGLQEGHWERPIYKPYEWESCSRQTWSATGYIRMVLHGLFGMRFSPGGITFKPFVPQRLGSIKLRGLKYRDSVLNITVEGYGSDIDRATVNGAECTDICIPASAKGIKDIKIVLRNS